MLLPLLLAAAPLLTPSESNAAGLITARALRGHVRFIASDFTEGRAPGSPGDQLTQHYLATQFETLGLEPAFPSHSYQQPVELIGVNGEPSTATFKGTGKPLVLKAHDDFMFVSGHQGPSSTLENVELVFVGYGIVAPEFKWNDFKDVDVKGKVVVVLNNDPEDDPALFAGKARLWYGRWDYKYEQARRQGALGAIIIHTTESAGYPWQVVQTSWAGEQFSLPNADGGLQVRGWVTEGAAKTLVSMGGKDLDELRTQAQRREFRPVSLGVTVSASWKNQVTRRTSGNVVGVWPGSDPALKEQAIVVTAHHDHLGRKDVKAGDGIYNGAVDNASGCAALLTIARALTSMPVRPKRTVIFASVAAEEQGLLGSEYFVAHPPVPIERLVANLNIDGLNIWGRTKDVSAIGFGKSSIDQQLTVLAAAQGRTVKPDALPDRGFFYRSDQFNFAKVGIPSAYFSSGQDFIGRPPDWGREQRQAFERNRYHQPSDELTDDWNLDGAVEDVQLMFELLISLGNFPTPPHWNPGDEFEHARIAKHQ